jgi:hypothetical protein
MRRDGGERLRRYRVRYLPTGQAVRLRLPAGRCAPKRLPTYLPTYLPTGKIKSPLAGAALRYLLRCALDSAASLASAS